KLQVLQVTSNRTSQPITFQAIDAAHPTGSTFTDDVLDLHNYGTTFAATFVTIHDTAIDVSGFPFDANAAAKAAGGTPFKRPENGQFRPGSMFKEFFFDETGDLNATSAANAQFGGWGTVMKLTFDGIGSDTGTLAPFFVGDSDHNSFDGVS